MSSVVAISRLLIAYFSPLIIYYSLVVDEDQKQYPLTPIYSGGVESCNKLLISAIADYHGSWYGAERYGDYRT